MKIASITLYCNEGFRLESWKKYVSEYKDDLYLQIIVNNGKKEDTGLLQESFPDAIVLYSETSNMISSYNMALKYILNNTDADSILQVTNDLRIESGGLRLLHSILYSNESYGLISPVILKKDSDIIEVYGASIDGRNLDFIHLHEGDKLSDVEQKMIECSGLPGGCFLTKRTAYETLGLQDAKINMYCDEVDTGIKCMKYGIRQVATSEVKSWHQHINPAGRKLRSPMAFYYQGRNVVYLARKYYDFRFVTGVVIHRLFLVFKEFGICVRDRLGGEAYRCAWAYLKGVLKGIVYI